MIFRALPRLLVLTAAVASVAVLAQPTHAYAEETSIALRIEVSGTDAPAIAYALQPGGSVNLDAIVDSVNGEIDPTACDAVLATSGSGQSALSVSNCAGSDLAATVAITAGDALAATGVNVSYDGQGGSSSDLALSCWILGTIVVLLVIAIIALVEERP